MGQPIFVRFCTTTRLRNVMTYPDGFSISSVVFYLQSGQICRIPYKRQKPKVYNDV